VLSLLTLYFAIIPFFISNWEEASTSYMRFGWLGVTEAQFTSMAVLVATGALGSGMWGHSLLGLVDMKVLFVAVGTFGVAYQCLSSFFFVIRHFQQSQASAYDRHLSLVSLAQFTVYIVLSTLIVLSPSPLYHDHPRLVLWLIGLLSAYQVSRLIICHVTLDPYPPIFLALLPLPFLTVALWWRGGQWVGVEWVWLYVLFTSVLYVHFIYVAINQITRYLGIHCFHIKPRIIQSTSGPVAEPQ
jgi:hypothetical protein